MIKITDEMREGWEAAAVSGFLTEGKWVRLFEKLISDEYKQGAVAMNSAGSALFSVLRYYAPKKVLVPNNTFAATGAMALEAGAEITVVDSAPGDLSMGIDALKEAHNYHDMVILTHVGGWLAKDYAEISKFCEETGMILVEDAAHAYGVDDCGVKAGAYGDAAVFSFYPTKSVPIGEGGAVISTDSQLIEFVSEFRNYGKYKQNGKVCYRGAGFNFRMDEWTGVVAAQQLFRLPEILKKRSECAQQLMKVVKPALWGPGSNWYKYVAPAKFVAKRQAGMVYQKSDQLRSIWPNHPKVRLADEYPVSDWIDKNLICLPLDEDLYAELTTKEIADWLME